ncbi:hypothetical protein HMPREF9123_1872, partial [Neisseria bacilliformis ATCC BAA-1200]
ILPEFKQYFVFQELFNLHQDSHLRGNDGTRVLAAPKLCFQTASAIEVGCVAQATHAVSVFGETRIRWAAGNACAASG